MNDLLYAGMKLTKHMLVYMAVFVPVWMGFCYIADFVIMFESRAYTMSYGVISFLICVAMAGAVADKYGV